MFGFDVNRIMMLAGLRLGISEAFQFMQPPPPTRGRRAERTIKRGHHPNRTTQHATNGERECSRRRRQIAQGRLRTENGLETAQESQLREDAAVLRAAARKAWNND